MEFGQTGLRATHCQSPQGYAVKKTKMYKLKYKMVFSLDRLKGLIQICVSMRVTSLNCTEFVPVLEWLKTGNELGVYINIHVEC